MSAPEAAPRRLPLAPQRYGRIVVVGGGCYGAYYVRQLGRAIAAGALVADEVVVVDRDPACRVANATGAVADLPPSLKLEVADWREFFPMYLGQAAAAPAGHARDAIVPSPLMPHLMYEWLLGRARARWPGRRVETRPLPVVPPTPWQSAAPDGTHYVSFATWMCPINCIEPARCPHTRGPRDWSLPDAMRAWVGRLGAEGMSVAGPVILHCVHRAWGVGMFDVADVVGADVTVAAEGTAGAATVLVGTASHCHGALNLLDIGE